ncbi:hypothetical protein SLA2020_029510 [Shorea laevis]
MECMGSKGNGSSEPTLPKCPLRLSKSRKHSVKSFNRMILWLTYLTADWVAIVALGKLSNSHAESPTTNVLRALWAPLLILQLGGPDTITAYSVEDNQLWNRHILTLILRSFFAVSVIYLPWTSSWPSLLNIPLIFAGILKYVERILCLEGTSSKKIDPIISIFNDPKMPIAPKAASFLHFLISRRKSRFKNSASSLLIIFNYETGCQ